MKLKITLTDKNMSCRWSTLKEKTVIVSTYFQQYDIYYYFTSCFVQPLISSNYYQIILSTHHFRDQISDYF